MALRRRQLAKRFNSRIIKFLIWKDRYLSETNFVLLMSGVVGILSGLAAVALKSAAYEVQYFLADDRFYLNDSDYDYGPLFYPTTGLFLTVVLSRRVFKMDVGHGITDILYFISKKRAKMPTRDLYARMITSVFTVGFGGSAGLEAPIVVTGAAIGSKTASGALLKKDKRVLLLGCGIAGAISAIFNAPVAGVIFALEVILVNVSISRIIPLLIASISAKVVSLFLLEVDVLFSFDIKDTFGTEDIPFAIGLGMLCGGMSLYFMFILKRVENYMVRLDGVYVKALAGGLILTSMVILFPSIYGEGYRLIKAFLNEEEFYVFSRNAFFSSLPSETLFIIYVLLLLLIKPFANGVTLGAGGSGGTFAPSLFVGGTLGFLFAHLINVWGIAELSESNFTLIGMCGAMSGIQYAPLSAIFLIAELTSGYELFMPLMLVSAIAYSTVSYFQPKSMYERGLLDRGVSLEESSDEQTLQKIRIYTVIENNFKSISPEAKLSDLVELIKQSPRNLFPVIDEKKHFVGMVSLNDVREIMFDESQQHSVQIKDLLQEAPTFLDYWETMKSAVGKFEETGAWNLPVLRNGKYAGFVSKSNLFNEYREQLRLINEQ